MSLRKAVNNKCRECIYDSNGPGTWRQQVEQCTSFNCPLFPIRPKTTSHIGAGKNVASSSSIDPICPEPEYPDSERSSG